jgi:hypothetical protein
MALTPEQIRAWTERTCAEQQVAVAVTNPITLNRIGVLLGRAEGAAPAGAPPPAPALQPPDRIDAVGVESSRTRLGVGVDDGVVEDRGDDGALPVEVEPGPLVA